MATATSLIPQPFWFRPAFGCQRLEKIPRSESSSPLLNLPENCTLPALDQLNGREPWAEFRAAWNPQGLAIAVSAQEVSSLASAGLEAFELVQIWVDTRDTRDIHRASRFCHRFGVSARR